MVVVIAMDRKNKEFDYEKLGLKCGLEVHQQLNTGKLFCRCPSVLRDSKPDFTVERKMRAIASELGEYDAAALEAAKKNYTYIYEGYNDTTCLVELDEEPPMPVNKDAIEVALKVAMMADSKILDSLFVMRKTVVDGSMTTGFQRTALVATGGSIDVGGNKIGVQTIVLEGDAARPMRKNENEREIVYRIDRLEIPLIELATDPDIRSPEQAKQVAVKIGEILRRTCGVKRGLGTIRQDLNVSIREGSRTEIKGVQNLALMDEYVRREVRRQEGLVGIMKLLKGKGLKKNMLNEEPVELGGVFASTNAKIISGTLARKQVVLGLKLGLFGGVVGTEIQPGRRLGTEFADRVKVKTGIGGIIHSDEKLSEYGISESEAGKVREKLGCNNDDAFVLICGERENAYAASDAVRERAVSCLDGVPGETRNALEDGNTAYSRPLPGAARMYPETDLANVEIPQEYLEEVRKKLPRTVEEREKLYRKWGMNQKLIDKMKLNNSACRFEELIGRGHSPTTAAVLLLEGLVQLRRENIETWKISYEMIEDVLNAEKKGIITKDIFLNVLREWVKDTGKDIGEVIGGMQAGKVEDSELRKVVREIVEKNKELVKAKGDYAAGALMGETMKVMKGKADGKTVSKMLKEEIAKAK